MLVEASLNQLSVLVSPFRLPKSFPSFSGPCLSRQGHWTRTSSLHRALLAPPGGGGAEALSALQTMFLL